MKYVLIALLAALAAFLLAPLLLHEPPAPAAHAGSLEARFPMQTAAFKQPAAEDPRWHEKRGHAFSLKDRDESDPTGDPLWQRVLAGRPKPRPFPGGCLDCHASDGTTTAPYWDARARLDRPIGCPDCHDPQTAVLRLTRPGLPPAASTQEMRTLVCAQCHRDYYLAPGTRFPTGRTVEEIEAFFAASGFRDWDHAETGAAVLLARHPQFEMHSQGVHARSGVACADCHMPFQRQGALRITAHNARSPLADLERACLPCHRSPPEEMKARIQAIQQRTDALLARAQAALVALIDDIHSAGAVPPSVLALQTKAQWRVTFVAADKSRGFHAPQEAARILAEAIDYARQGQLAIARTRTR
jgi:nitrite reductase (cytochrome c-552)